MRVVAEDDQAFVPRREDFQRRWMRWIWSVMKNVPKFLFGRLGAKFN